MRALLPALALALSGCVYQAQIPHLDATGAASVGGRQPGSYAALVQTGGWNIDSTVVGWNCGPHTYKADINPAWSQGMARALQASLENVAFPGRILNPADISAGGYAAFVSFTQSNATSRVTVVPRMFFGADSVSETTLEGIMVVQLPDGTREQQPIVGRGTSTKPLFSCGDAVESVGASAAAALQELLRNAATSTKLILAQRVKRV
ncbi:MAG TPA: hypothetical protein VEY95_17045 [Azospirillaceae bacterium]|nr:hypothetical protein [Azospirillaceae bacterium]